MLSDSPAQDCGNRGDIVGAIQDDVAIRVSNVNKVYQLWDRPSDRLKQPIYSRVRRWLGLRPKNYSREFWALRDISFDIKRGETIGIVGQNGSGKSTLLQIICGTLYPTAGSVEISGRVAALLELGSGFNLEFTGRENIYMNAAVLGLSKAEVDIKFDDIVEFADLGEFIDQPVKTYSSGMVVRLAFSVIAHVEADILVIDEALSVGDVFFVQKCMRFLRNFMKTGTVLFVSHDMSAILNLCSYSLLLKDGVIADKGKPKKVAETYLSKVYELQQGDSFSDLNSETEMAIKKSDLPSRDMRLDFINRTPLRNDIELFAFDVNASGFGKGGAKVVKVQLCDRDGAPLSWVVGGESVRLDIYTNTHQFLNNVIVGFQVKDRLGQVVFAENTYIAYIDSPVTACSGESIHAQFSFDMPVLPVGDYSISTQVADGTQENHVQHHWVHDALLFKSHASSICHGLIAVPMHEIRLKKTTI